MRQRKNLNEDVKANAVDAADVTDAIIIIIVRGPQS
jgi:hypothetical protein